MGLHCHHPHHDEAGCCSSVICCRRGERRLVWKRQALLLRTCQCQSDFDAGSANQGAGSVECVPVEWDSATGLGPEAMFFETASTEFEVWAWDYHPSRGFGDVMPKATCDGELWYKTEDMGAGFCTPNLEKGWNGCGTVVCYGDIFCTGC